MTTRRHPAALVVAGGVLLLATGCGDGDGPAVAPTTLTPSSTTSTTEAEPTTTTSTTAVALPTVVDEVLHGGSQAQGHSYEVTFPQLRGLDDESVQEVVNADIRSTVTGAVERFVASLAEAGEPPPALSGQQSSLTGTYEVARLDHRLASLRLELSSYYAGAAHPSGILHTLNYDLGTGERLELGDLFTEGAPYLQRLSELARERLYAELGDAALPDFVEPGTEPVAENFDGWSLTGQELVVTFDEYQVAPYAAGMPRVSIPFATLRTILDPRGPLAIRN